ncbi:MAG: hypothetical protein WB791_06605 [Waddliaceae bacterium]
MKKIVVFVVAMAQTAFMWADGRCYLGPQFNYMRLHFDNPSYLQGYMGGITVGGEYQWKCLFTGADFEGYWNAGPITGRPCERSSLCEYLLEWKLGRSVYRSNRCVLFKPYLGLGWDRFKNEQNPQGVGLGYTYHAVFIPIGFYAYHLVNNGCRYGIQFEWRPDVYSCVRVFSTNFRTKKEHAFRIQLPLEMSYPLWCGCIGFHVVPFFDWNRFGKVHDATSNRVNVEIPRLTRWYLGLRVLLGYDF